MCSCEWQKKNKKLVSGIASNPSYKIAACAGSVSAQTLALVS